MQSQRAVYNTAIAWAFIFLISISKSTDAQFQAIGDLDLNSSLTDIWVTGHYAYVSSWDTALFVVDVADPWHPALTAILPLPNPCEDIFVSGHYAYLANFGQGLSIVDFYNPAEPTIIGTCDRARFCHGVAVEKKLRFYGVVLSLLRGRRT